MKRRKEGILKIDMHCHTRAGSIDSKISLDEYIRLLKEQGFGGMMITEQVFGIDGIGRLSYNALVDSDIPFVMGYNMFLAILAVIGTLLSDIMYSIVDPRVKLTK